MNLRLERRLLTTIVALSVALRLGSALYQGNRIEPLPGVFDQISYDALARRVVEGHGFSFATDWWPATRAGEPTAHWSYLYTLFLALVYKLFAGNVIAARILQAIIAGVLHPLLAWRLGSRMAGSPGGLIAAFVAAVYSYFVLYGGALMTETFYILGVLWVLDTALTITDSSEPAKRSLWLRLGLATACAVLLRQVFLLAVPLLFAWILWTIVRRKRQPIMASLRGIAVTTAALAVAILPWTIRNQISFGTFSLLNSSAGFAFYWANHPVHGDQFIPILPENGPTYSDLLPPDVLPLNEAQMERSLMKRALQDAAAEPGRIARLSVSRLPEYFRFWPSRDSSTFNDFVRFASFGLLLPLAVAGMILASRNSHKLNQSRLGLELFLLFCLFYTLIHLMSWTLIRYRLPVDAVLVIFASIGVAEIAGRLMEMRTRRRAQHTAPLLADGREWRTR